MTQYEQIVTCKVRWTEDNACEDEDTCCGVGQCENRTTFDPYNGMDLSEDPCVTRYEVLQVSPAREVISE